MQPTRKRFTRHILSTRRVRTLRIGGKRNTSRDWNSTCPSNWFHQGVSSLTRCNPLKSDAVVCTLRRIEMGVSYQLFSHTTSALPQILPMSPNMQTASMQPPRYEVLFPARFRNRNVVERTIHSPIRGHI
jgi:hypothetical protein